jgi:hypothetical protein
MDFITGLPTTQKGNDSIWVIVDHLTKSAHFLPVETTNRLPQYADRYIAKIVRLHGVPRTIVSDRGSQFTAHFWERLQKGLGTKLVYSTAYHPQTSGQTAPPAPLRSPRYRPPSTVLLVRVSSRLPECSASVDLPLPPLVFLHFQALELCLDAVNLLHPSLTRAGARKAAFAADPHHHATIGAGELGPELPWPRNQYCWVRNGEVRLLVMTVSPDTSPAARTPSDSATIAWCG